MYKGISAPFIHRPIATTLLMVAVLLVGLVAFPSLPVAPLPQVDFPTITVSASLPGASPDTMATSVAQPLERQIAQIPGVSQMTSTSALGATAITVQFDLNRNIDAAANDIQAAINAAAGQLPKDLPSPPTYRKVNPSDTPILILSVQSDVAPIIDVDDAAENVLAQHLSQISGVSLVRVGGQQTPAIRIQVDPAKLVEKGMQLEDVRTQIGIATVNTPKGALIGPKQTFTIQDNDQLTQAKAWNDVIIAYRNGAPVRVRDIGQAVAGPQDSTQAAWSNGKPQRLSRRVQDPRRERHQHGRGDQGHTGDPAGFDPADHSCQHSLRSHHDHPRLGARRRVHPRAHRRPRGDGDLRFLAQPLGDDHSERYGSARPARRLRAHVGGRLQPRQSLAHGVHHLGRFRRRRRDRDAREHHPPHRGRGKALSGGAQGFRRDRLHHHLDLGVAGRGAHPAPDDERHHRPPVPRILGHDRDDDLRLGRRFADADPDDGLALSQEPRRGASRPALQPQRERASPRLPTATSGASISCSATASRLS